MSWSKAVIEGEIDKQETEWRKDTDKTTKIYSCIEPPKNISKNEVTEHTLESQIDIERNRATHREKQTEGLKMDLCKLAPVSCCFSPQIYAL